MHQGKDSMDVANRVYAGETEHISSVLLLKCDQPCRMMIDGTLGMAKEESFPARVAAEIHFAYMQLGHRGLLLWQRLSIDLNNWHRY